jgi:serine/threonine protein kinase/ABC-type branched-subunit amino acid transport system substrate-binding protein
MCSLDSLNIGLLMSAYKASSPYSIIASGPSNLMGALMAVDEINSGASGLNVPPIKISYLDDKGSSAVALQGALALALNAFSGAGSCIVMGPGNSSPAMNSQLVLKHYNIPHISYSASSPSLSDDIEYPTFFRVVASDAFQATAIAEFLSDDLDYDRICVLNGLDAYSAKGAESFVSAAIDLGMTIVHKTEVAENPSVDDADDAVEVISSFNCKVIFCMTQASAAGKLVRGAASLRTPIIGKDSGYTWVFPDAITSGLETTLSVASADGMRQDGSTVPGLANAAETMRGIIGTLPLSPKGPKLDAFMASARAYSSTKSSCGENDVAITDSCVCNSRADFDGNLLFQHDHDSDPATPDKCTGRDFSSEDPDEYDYYAYDTIYSIAHAVDRVASGGAAALTHENLMDALREVSFEGVTGDVAFEENGDRQVGIGFTIVNHDGAALVELGDWLKDTGVTFRDGLSTDSIVWSSSNNVKPDAYTESDAALGVSTEAMYALLGVFGVGTCIIVFLFVRNWSMNTKVRRLSITNREVEMQNLHLKEEEEHLKEEVEVLQFNLRKKEHSEEELEVMKRAMQELTSERRNELRGCLIDSKEVRVDHLLGKGGFGVVNLATYKEQSVAMKQLLDINEDSVKRFRFECFLMKSLRHPNIVKLVGVCWDDDMFACCLEFVENGSLEDWLRKSYGKKHSMLKWKDQLFHTVLQCAEALQYLHNERYYSEDANDGKGAWRECIIHRDLKPDNMLLTKDWELKLTDFGEARAVEQNVTMTSVGTPIYVAPEVMRANRYDCKADVYSFAICIVAMIRGERNINEFYMQSLRKKMKRKTTEDIGVALLNNRMYNKGWRPLLPPSFELSYPALSQLVKDMWNKEPSLRPDFHAIVKRLNLAIRDEVRTNEEPEIVLYSEEPDSVYQERVKSGDGLNLSHIDEDGEEDEDEDEDEDEEALVEEVQTLKDRVAQLEQVCLEQRQEIERMKKKPAKSDAPVAKAARRWSMFDSKKARGAVVEDAVNGGGGGEDSPDYKV